MTMAEKHPKPSRARSKPLARHILRSDQHIFIARIYELSIVSMRFDSWDEVNKYPDCKYALETNEFVQALTSRVESLNLVGDLLWPNPIPQNFRDFPVSRYEWLMIALDVFLTRYISVVDCALLLTNQVFQCEIPARDCTIRALRKTGISAKVATKLESMLSDQAGLRKERNFRIHEGVERGFTQDDSTFRIAALLEHRQGRALGDDQFGRPINVVRSFMEALVEIQRDFNHSTRQLVRSLDSLYDHLGDEFENRFSPLIKVATHGFNVGARRSNPLKG